MADRVTIVGAGVAGLVAALLLASRGAAVTVLERDDAVGGKMRPVEADGVIIDAGPTVFTLRGIFDEIFSAAGVPMPFALRPLSVLARHAWNGEARLDLFADRARSAEAIGDFAGTAAARGYLDFCKRARAIWDTLERPFVRAPQPSLLSLAAATGPGALRVAPFETLWRALAGHFPDPRLRQLFARYATYSGASPFQAPATLMLIAHVEQEGVWRVEGGMAAVAEGLAAQARAQGATIRCAAHVAAVEGGGVRLADGEWIEADAVLAACDVAALAAGLLGPQARAAVARPGARSLSAVTWAMTARAEGFPLVRHNVFFAGDYHSEFVDIFDRDRLPRDATVYVCAQDRDDDAAAPDGGERLLCLVNAPPNGDRASQEPSEIAACRSRMMQKLQACGLMLTPQTMIETTPAAWERRFPGTGGALYGPAQHGWRASFSRPFARSRMPGLYLAGGSTHPGPGVPMAALSGQFAAEAILADLASTSPSRRTAMRGGMSTR